MKLNQLLTRLATCAALSVAAISAQASPILFTLTGTNTASWQMGSSPTPNQSDDLGFSLLGVPATFNGTSTSNTQFSFATNGNGGGLIIYWDGTHGFGISGAELFTGDTTEPTIKLGTFELTQWFVKETGDGNVGDVYSLTISAVPEPATLALVLGGLGLVGVTAKRRRAS